MKLTLPAIALFLAPVLMLFLNNCSSPGPDLTEEEPAAPQGQTTYFLPDSREQPAGRFLSGNGFVDWYRYPAEERTWLVQQNATAYTRDVVVGGETFISGAADGETWTASAVLPNGQTLNWGAITFHTNYNGQQNCFVSPSWVICGGTSLYVLWYTEAQCQPSGTWTMRFFNNGAQFHEGTFKVLPQIPPGKVPLASQLGNTDHYDNQCKKASDPSQCVNCAPPDTVPCTIAKLGCWLTGASMILGYHGVSVTPSALNTWLINNNGYSGGNVDGYAVARYARNVGGVQIFYAGSSATSNLVNRLCARGPQLAHVRKPGRTRYHHFVTVTGQDEMKTTYLINDPAGGTAIKLSDRYDAAIKSIRVFEGPEYQFRDDLSGVVIAFRSPGELLLTDPQGQRAGFDPATGQSYSEIANSFYEPDEFIEDPDVGDEGMESKILEVARPAAAGDYQLKVTGTGDGTYDLVLNTYDVMSTPSVAGFNDVPITTGAVHTYSFNYDKVGGTPVQVIGGFDGGGQRPRDVNKFLSYGTVSSATTTVGAGTTSFPLLVVYGATTDPMTFQATLDRVDATALFSPAPGTSEIVDIPLQPGKTVLSLSVEGALPGRTARDSDRLIFSVAAIGQ